MPRVEVDTYWLLNLGFGMGCWEGGDEFSFRTASLDGNEGSWEGERHHASHHHFSPTTNVAMPHINAEIRWHGQRATSWEHQ